MARYRAKHPIFIGMALYRTGDEFESDLVPGLNWEPVDEAALKAVAAAKPQPMPKMPGQHGTTLVEIPEDWEEMHHLKIINLAKKLGMVPTGKLTDAKALIEKELVARQMAAAA